SSGDNPTYLAMQSVWLSHIAGINLDGNRLNAQLDYGRVFPQTGTGISSFHAFRSSVSVLKRYLGVHASFQYNPYTLNELRYLRSNASFRQYAVGPYTEFEAFNQKVQFRLYGNL